MKTLEFNLARPAKNKGGDRYEAVCESGERFVVYFPQEISREVGLVGKLIVTVKREEE